MEQEREAQPAVAAPDGSRVAPATSLDMHPLLRLQRSAGNRAVGRLIGAGRGGPAGARGIAPTVQRDDQPPPAAADLDADLAKAMTDPADWPKAALVLNGFNDDDITKRVGAMTPDQWQSLNAAVQPWNSRVRSAVLDRLYQDSFGKGDYRQAAIYLNGFNNDDIDKHTQTIPEDKVWPFYQGVLDAMTGPSQQRLLDSLGRLHKGTVSPTPGVDAIRMLDVADTQGVPSTTAGPVALAMIGASPGSATQQAGDPVPDHDRLVGIVAGAMTSATPPTPEPSQLAEGKLAHTMIGAVYAAQNMPTVIDPTIIKLVQAAATALAWTTGQLDTLHKRMPEEVLDQIKTRPDIADLGKLQIYEIKSLESAARAVPEMLDYIELLGSIKIPGFEGFHPGSPTNPGTEGVLPYPNGGKLVWACPWPGAIVYVVTDQTDPLYSPERLRSDALGGLSAQAGVESMVALGLSLAIGAALLPLGSEAVPAAASLARACESYGVLIPLMAEALTRNGQQVPQLTKIITP